MFTEPHKAVILLALDALERIQKRGKNNTQNPEFIPVYEKLIQDIQNTRNFVQTQTAPAKQK